MNIDTKKIVVAIVVASIIIGLSLCFGLYTISEAIIDLGDSIAYKSF